MKSVLYLSLLTALMLCISHVDMSAQTDDYTVTILDGVTGHDVRPFDRAYIFNVGPDTLVVDGNGAASLYIDFDKSFYGNYLIGCCVSTTNDSDAAAPARLMGRNNATEEWKVISNGIDGNVGGTACNYFYMSEIVPGAPLFGFPYIKLRLYYEVEDLIEGNIIIVTTSLVLKPL